MVETPPALAAALAVPMVSLCSSPGSRNCVRMSTRPGARIRPSQSTTSTDGGGASLNSRGPRSAMTPPLVTSAPGSSMPVAGSISRALT